MNDADNHELRRVATDFRVAIERSRAENASPQLPYFPEGACRMVSILVALHLRRRGMRHDIRFVTGHIPGVGASGRHAWLEIGDSVVDLTADPFGEASVVVGAPTRFHDSLDTREEREMSEVIAALSEQEANRFHRFLEPIEQRLPAWAPDAT